MSDNDAAGAAPAPGASGSGPGAGGSAALLKLLREKTMKISELEAQIKQFEAQLALIPAYKTELRKLVDSKTADDSKIEELKSRLLREAQDKSELQVSLDAALADLQKERNARRDDQDVTSLVRDELQAQKELVQKTNEEKQQLEEIIREKNDEIDKLKLKLSTVSRQQRPTTPVPSGFGNAQKSTPLRPSSSGRIPSANPRASSTARYGVIRSRLSASDKSQQRDLSSKTPGAVNSAESSPTRSPSASLDQKIYDSLRTQLTILRRENDQLKLSLRTSIAGLSQHDMEDKIGELRAQLDKMQEENATMRGVISRLEDQVERQRKGSDNYHSLEVRCQELEKVRNFNESKIRHLTTEIRDLHAREREFGAMLYDVYKKETERSRSRSRTKSSIRTERMGTTAADFDSSPVFISEDLIRSSTSGRPKSAKRITSSVNNSPGPVATVPSTETAEHDERDISEDPELIARSKAMLAYIERMKVQNTKLHERVEELTQTVAQLQQQRERDQEMVQCLQISLREERDKRYKERELARSQTQTQSRPSSASRLRMSSSARVTESKTPLA